LQNALVYYKKSLALDESLNDTEGVASSYANIGNVYADQGEYELALEYYNKAKVIKQELNNYYGLGIAHSNIGSIYGEQGNYPLALENFQLGLDYYTTAGATINTISCYINIGYIYQKQNKYPKALEYSNKALRILTEQKIKDKLSPCLNTMGEIYEAQNMYDSAFVFYTKALNNSIEINDAYSWAISLNHVGDLFISQNKPNKAFSNYKKALKINLELENQLGICISQLGIGKVHYLNSDNKQALFNTLESQKIAIKLNLLAYRKEISKLLSDIYNSSGDYKNALVNYKNYKLFNDSLFNKKNIQKITEITYEYKYKGQIKNAENRELKLKETVKISKNDLKASQKNTFLAIIIILVCLILIGGLVFYLKLRSIKSENQKMNIEQKLLRSQMTPHFIFNSLAVLQGMILNNENEKSVFYLSKFSKLLRIVLENSRDELVMLEDELQAIENYIILQNFDSTNPIDYDVKIEAGIQLTRIKVPPMLIQPFIENAIIHAFDSKMATKKIELNLKFINDDLVCTISDNGIGINTANLKVQKSNKKSLATKISSERLQILAKELKMKGSITIENRQIYNMQGTVVTLIIPHLKQ